MRIAGRSYSIASRIPPGRFMWKGRCVKMLAHWLGCFEWLDWCVVFVCKMVVRFFIWYSLWELWVVLLVVGVHFGSSYGPLGSIFEGFGGLLGSILGALGVPLAPF